MYEQMNDEFRKEFQMKHPVIWDALPIPQYEDAEVEFYEYDDTLRGNECPGDEWIVDIFGYVATRSSSFIIDKSGNMHPVLNDVLVQNDDTGEQIHLPGQRYYQRLEEISDPEYLIIQVCQIIDEDEEVDISYHIEIHKIIEGEY